MKVLTPIDFEKIELLANSIQRIGHGLVRAGLVIVIGWIGAMKFTAYEAHGIAAFVSSSPILSWTYNLLSERTFSSILGFIEIAIALLLLLGAKNNRLGIAAATASLGMFVTTLSFMLSTPGTFEPSLGFPALSVVPGQFLIKDLIAVGASVLLLGDALASFVKSVRIPGQTEQPVRR